MFTSPNFFIVPSEYTSAAAETASLATGSAALVNGAKLLGFACINTSASAAWVQVFDGNAAPAGSAVPKISLAVAATSSVTFGTGDFNCSPMQNGIVIVLSSTPTTYTAVSSALFTYCAFVI